MSGEIVDYTRMLEEFEEASKNLYMTAYFLQNTDNAKKAFEETTEKFVKRIERDEAIRSRRKNRTNYLN